MSLPQTYVTDIEACNPVNFAILDPEDPNCKSDWQITIYVYV
jgi:hypothetical protein